MGKTTTSPFTTGLTADNLFNVQGNFVNVTVSYKTAWGIPDAAVDELVAERAVYEPLYHKAQNKNTRTRADVAAHKLAAERYLKKLRRFWNKWIEDGDMPTEEKLLLGGERLDTEQSPGPVITEGPHLRVRTLTGGDIEVKAYSTTDQTKASIPKFAKRIDYAYAIYETEDIPPADPEDYPKRGDSSRAKFIIRAGAKNAGKRLYLISRWVNPSKPKQEGPWTKPISIVIP